MVNHSQETIDEFFIKDGKVIKNRKKRSVLLAIQEDMKFSILLPGKWRPIALSDPQNKELNKMLPTFTIAMLFCTALDLLSRVVKKQKPPRGQNGTYFKCCAKQWFDASQKEAQELWLLRNALSHQYSLNSKQSLIQFGHNKYIRKNSKGYWEFYLHAMYTQLQKSSREIYEYLSNEPNVDKKKTSDFLSECGFFYTA